MLLEHVPKFIKKIQHRINKEKSDRARKTLRRRDRLSLFLLTSLILFIILAPIAIARKIKLEPREWPSHSINRFQK